VKDWKEGGKEMLKQYQVEKKDRVAEEKEKLTGQFIATDEKGDEIDSRTTQRKCKVSWRILTSEGEKTTGVVVPEGKSGRRQFACVAGPAGSTLELQATLDDVNVGEPTTVKIVDEGKLILSGPARAPSAGAAANMEDQHPVSRSPPGCLVMMTVVVPSS
jgi:hypothetical protein